jgi:hypothetical protein
MSQGGEPWYAESKKSIAHNSFWQAYHFFPHDISCLLMFFYGSMNRPLVFMKWPVPAPLFSSCQDENVWSLVFGSRNN